MHVRIKFLNKINLAQLLGSKTASTKKWRKLFVDLYLLKFASIIASSLDKPKSEF